MKKVRLIRPDTVKSFRIAPYGDAEAVLSGRFRPMLAADVDKLRRDAAADRERRVSILAAALAPRILSWDADGAEPSAEALMVLPAPYLDALEQVITGYAPPAVDAAEVPGA